MPQEHSHHLWLRTVTPICTVGRIRGVFLILFIDDCDTFVGIQYFNSVVLLTLCCSSLVFVVLPCEWIWVSSWRCSTSITCCVGTVPSSRWQCHSPAESNYLRKVPGWNYCWFFLCFSCEYHYAAVCSSMVCILVHDNQYENLPGYHKYKHPGINLCTIISWKYNCYFIN